jgi:C-5 cytosine-specific DNA methylase
MCARAERRRFFLRLTGTTCKTAKTDLERDRPAVRRRFRQTVAMPSRLSARSKPPARRARGPVKGFDFFCGPGGLTRGMLDSGIDVLCGIDKDARLCDTYQKNNQPSSFENARFPRR